MSTERVEPFHGEDYVVRRVTGSASTKPYRCPGPPHTVAWPVVPTTFASGATGLDERRHWHNACWAARERR